MSVISDNAREAVIGYAEPCRINGMDLDERLRQMLSQPRADAGAGHGVPLIPDPAGVQPQRPRRGGLGSQRRDVGRDEARLAVVGKKSATCEEPLLRPGVAGTCRPQHRRHRIERLIR